MGITLNQLDLGSREQGKISYSLRNRDIYIIVQFFSPLWCLWLLLRLKESILAFQRFPSLSMDSDFNMIGRGVLLDLSTDPIDAMVLTFDNPFLEAVCVVDRCNTLAPFSK